MRYDIKNDKITITGGYDNQSIIEIPEQINGIAVTEIERYAFRDRLDITEVVLPSGIYRIGGHAFYNCKNLRRLVIHDGVRELEDGAFKNCYRLDNIWLNCHSNREGCLRNLLSDNIQELTLHVIYDNGSESELVFPTFEDDYVENTPARIFQSVCYGSGGAYRQCMQIGTLDYRDFDNLFDRSAREDRFEAAAGNCVGRLLYPYKLFSSAKDKYLKFARENDVKMMEYIINMERIDAVQLLCSNECLSQSGIDEIIEMARLKGNMEIFGLIMNYKNTHFSTEKKSFDL